MGVFRYGVQSMNTPDPKEDRLTLEVLSAVDSGSRLSQRRLANQMGVALGLANSYVKRCVRKGFIKISEAPANRYIYYLTPKGFSEKSRLTARFLSSSLDFYRHAANSCSDLYRQLADAGDSRVILCGNSELAEIALLQAMDVRVEVLGLFDPICKKTEFFSRPVWHELNQVPEVPRVLTSLDRALELKEHLVAESPGLQILIPEVLGISTD